jgi:hypothetical protein
MALVLADRVLETSTSEGLGTFALAGAQTGYQTFSNGIGNGNTCYYTINGQTTEQWEVGIGTVGAGTLARTTLISSNTGSFINFVAGVKNVFVTQPASKSIYKDASGNAIPLGSASATQLDITAQGNLRLQDTTGGEYVALQAPATLAASYTLTMPTDDGTTGQALVTDGSGVLSWSTAASGDVYGPASATDNAIARFDLTTGKIIQNSAVTIADDGATVIAANSASDGLRITQLGAGNALLVEDETNPDSSPFVIDNAGRILAGQTVSYLFNDYAGTSRRSQFQFSGTSLFASMFSITNWSAFSTSPSSLNLAKSRGAAVGTQAIVVNNDDIGVIEFSADDGTTFIPAASILAEVDGTPGTNDMPGRLVFSTTADGASSPTERMRITSAGSVGIGTTAPVGSLEVASSAATIVVRATDLTSRSLLLAAASDYSTSFRTTFINQYNASATGTTLGLSNANLGSLGFQNGSNAAIFTNGTNILKIGTNAATAIQIASNQVVSLGSSAGSESLRVTPVASAVNFLEINGAIAASKPFLYANGSDASVSMNLVAKGAGSYTFLTSTGTATQFVVAHTASAVNYFQVTGGATGGAVTMSAQGSDAAVSMAYASKSTGQHTFSTGGGTQLIIDHTASSVNYLQPTGAATGSSPVIYAAGSDANLNIKLVPKGTGVLQYGTYTAGIVAQAGYITIADAGGTSRRLLVG